MEKENNNKQFNLKKLIEKSPNDISNVASYIVNIVERYRVNSNKSENMIYIEDVVIQLVDYINDQVEPQSEIVWALASACDPNAIKCLEKVVSKYVSGNNKCEEAAYQACVGLVNLPNPPIVFLQDISKSGKGRPAKYAHMWLKHSV